MTTYLSDLDLEKVKVYRMFISLHNVINPFWIECETLEIVRKELKKISFNYRYLNECILIYADMKDGTTQLIQIEDTFIKTQDEMLIEIKNLLNRFVDEINYECLDE